MCRAADRDGPARPRSSDGRNLVALGAWTLCLVGFAATACRTPEPGSEPLDAEESAVEASSSPALIPDDPPAAPGALAPRLANHDGNLLLSWLEPEPLDRPERHRFVFSRFDGVGWSQPEMISEGRGYFANWADLPALASDTAGGLVAHWLAKLGADTYAYGAQLVYSTDAGAPWSANGLLHDDRSAVEHGFVSSTALQPARPDPLARQRPGLLQAFWLDGRSMSSKPVGAMQLRTALLTAGVPAPSTLLDDRVCECCSTDATTTTHGPIVVYRDRDASEVRDIAVVRAEGGRWSEPRLVHFDGWKLEGCPVNGPAIDAHADHVAVAWFTAAGDRPRVQVAFSMDGGGSFAEPLVIDDQQPIGRVDVVVLPDGGGDAIVSWLGRSGEGAEIRIRRVSPAGGLGAAMAISDSTNQRSSGVPQMARFADRLALSWREDREPARLRFATLPPPPPP